jgi:UDP-2,3-diacylglucosamine pyrophosphatase LpxH
MKVLTCHGYIFDEDFNQSPIQGAVVGELDRLSNDLDWGPLNALRKSIQAAHGATNDYLIAGATKLGYDVTICGHSHLQADLVMPNGKRFLNTNCWLKGRDHGYVLFPESRVAYISDLHIGADECDADAIATFLTFASGKGWKVVFLGDTFDLYARSAEYIRTHDAALVGQIDSYSPKTIVEGNHDHDAGEIGKLVDLSKIGALTFEIYETDDRPAWIGFPA